MGPRSRHTAQEGDAFCLLEMNVRWFEKGQSIPEKQHFVKMLEETGTKVSIATVKRVLYRLNLKGRSARKNPLLQNLNKKSQTTVCNFTWGQRLYFLEKCPMV